MEMILRFRDSINATDKWAKTTALQMVFCLLALLCSCRQAEAAKPAAGSAAGIQSYVDKVSKKVLRSWYPANGEHAHVCVRFRVHKNGQVSWIEVMDASSVAAVNNSARHAIVQAAPLPALPAAAGASLDLEATFDSNLVSSSHDGYASSNRSQSQKSASLLAEANALSSTGKVEEAIESLEKAQKLTPYNRRVVDALIAAYIKQSASLEGNASSCPLHKALLIDPCADSARSELNKLLTDSGGNPESFEARLSLARKLAEECDYDGAVCEYGEAWRIKESPELASEINKACRRRKNSSQVNRWKTILERSESADSHIGLGKALESIEDFEGARKEFEKALSMNPSSEMARASLSALKEKIDAAGKKTDEQETEVSDDFPYEVHGRKKLAISVVKNRKRQVDYLSQACKKKIIRWAVNRIPLRLYVGSGRGVPGYKPQFSRYVVDAFAAWSKASGGKVSYVVVRDPRAANIVLGWTADAKAAHMGGNEQGRTQFSYRFRRGLANNCTIQSAKIWILTLGRHTHRKLSDAEMRAVLLHEVGHALGISGHSPYKSDVMFPTLNSAMLHPSLTDRDAATVRKLYQGYPIKKLEAARKESAI